MGGFLFAIAYTVRMTLIPAGDWVSVLEAAELLKLTKRRVQVFIKSGRLPAKQFGNAFMVLRADLKAFESQPRPTGRKRTAAKKPVPKRKPKA